MSNIDPSPAASVTPVKSASPAPRAVAAPNKAAPRVWFKDAKTGVRKERDLK